MLHFYPVKIDHSDQSSTKRTSPSVTSSFAKNGYLDTSFQNQNTMKFLNFSPNHFNFYNTSSFKRVQFVKLVIQNGKWFLLIENPSVIFFPLELTMFS